MTQKLTWEKPGRDEERFKKYLILALLRSGVCVTLQDSRFDYLFIANLLDSWSVDPNETPTDKSIFGPELAERLRVLKAQVHQTGETGEIESGVGSDHHFQFIVEAIPSHDDDVELMTTIIDLSEERRREKILRTLLREVSHRSKNLLAIIQSIASQTALHSDTLDQFVRKFRGRLHSLSHSQDLITDSSWRGARFHDLVRQQIERYVPDAPEPVSIDGDNVMLSPNTSLHLGLALHELIVNAVSHGSLKRTTDSEISVACTRRKTENGQVLVFTWQEDVNGIAAERMAPANTGTEMVPRFGSLVLERIVPSSLGGTATYTVAPRQIGYKLVFPSDEDD